MDNFKSVNSIKFLRLLFIMINKTNKIEEIIKLCEAAISKQLEKNKKGGFGLDDYTDGRIIGGASLARNILRIIKDSV